MSSAFASKVADISSCRARVRVRVREG